QGSVTSHPDAQSQNLTAQLLGEGMSRMLARTRMSLALKSPWVVACADSDGGSNASGEGGGLQRVFVVNASEIGAGSGLPGQRDTSRRGRRSARARRRAGAGSRPPVVSPRPTGEPRNRPVPPRPVGEPRIRPILPSPPGEPRIRPVPPSLAGESRIRPVPPRPTDAPRIRPASRMPIPVPPLPAAAQRSIMPLLGKMAGKAKVLPGEAVISAGLKAVELYQSDDPIEKKLEGATEVAGSALGGWGGAAAGAAIGTMILPVVGTAIGAAIGGALGSWGGSEVGGLLGKELFSSPEKENKPVSLLAAPPVPVALPGPVVPTLGATAKAFDNDRVPLMARGPAPALAPSGPLMGDVGRAMTEKPAASPAAPIVIKPEAPKMPIGGLFRSQGGITTPRAQKPWAWICSSILNSSSVRSMPPCQLLGSGTVLGSIPSQIEATS
ncbi:Prophage PSPPH06, putative tail tape measure domain protein, partial [Pseudomonas savastanoi pv. phaseolicola]